MMFESKADVQREAFVCDVLEKKWKCEIKRLGPYSAFDAYALRDQKLCAIVEIKTRGDRTRDKFPTVLMNLNKWFSLMQAEIGLGVSAFYVVAFTDGIFFVRIGSLPVRDFKISYRGRTDRPHAANDQSPCIEVPIQEFVKICEVGKLFELERENENLP